MRKVVFLSLLSLKRKVGPYPFVHTLRDLGEISENNGFTD